MLLDLQLSDMDGNTLIGRIRSAKTRNTPWLHSHRSRRPGVRALAAGADDVVERDIDRAELIARIHAIVRRSRGFSQSLLRVGELTLDVNQHAGDRPRHKRSTSPRKEFAILQLLVLRRNMIMTKEAILSQVYGGMDEPEIKIIDVFICKISRQAHQGGASRRHQHRLGDADTPSRMPDQTPQRIAPASKARPNRSVRLITD